MRAGATSGPVVFISYRRDDSGGQVGRLYDALSARLGGPRIFLDIDHIGAGQDFVKVIDDAVTRATVMLVVIGKRWAGTGKVGARRIDDPGDFVRMEVAAGLRREGLRVVPVLISGAKMPSGTTLPDELKDLSRRNAVELSDTRWREDVARLMAGIGDAPATRAIPTLPGLPAGSARRLAPWIGGAVAAVLVAWGGARAIGGRSAAQSPTQLQSSGSVIQTQVPKGDPATVPSSIEQGAHAALGQAHKWRADAQLTDVSAQLVQGSDGAESYQVSYGFRSPLDGVGLTVITGVPDGPRYKKEPVAGKSSMHAIPDGFIDLPLAVQAARQAGMFGQLKDARLGTATSGSNAGTPVWTIKPTPSDQYRVYYVNATTGKLLTSGQTQQSHDPKFVSKLKGLFK